MGLRAVAQPNVNANGLCWIGWLLCWALGPTERIILRWESNRRNLPWAPSEIPGDPHHTRMCKLLVCSILGYTLLSTIEKAKCTQASNFQTRPSLARWRACPTEKHETNTTTPCRARVSQFSEAFQLFRIRFRYCFDFLVRGRGSSPLSALF